MDDARPVAIKVADAAKRLDLSRSAAYALARRGDLPGLIRLGGALRVSVSQLDAWIEANSAKPLA